MKYNFSAITYLENSLFLILMILSIYKMKGDIKYENIKKNAGILILGILALRFIPYVLAKITSYGLYESFLY